MGYGRKPGDSRDPRTAGPGLEPARPQWRTKAGTQRVPGPGLSQRMDGRRHWSHRTKAFPRRVPDWVSPVARFGLPASRGQPRAGPWRPGRASWSAWLQPWNGAHVATASQEASRRWRRAARKAGGPTALRGRAAGSPGSASFLGNRPPPACCPRLQVAEGDGWRVKGRGPGWPPSGSSARKQLPGARGRRAPGKAPAPARRARPSRASF